MSLHDYENEDKDEDETLIKSKKEEEEEEAEAKEEVAEEPAEEEIHFFPIEYKCEDCDYRWKTKRKASLSDQDRTGTDRWFVDDSNVHCPMCGSCNITRV